MDKFKYKEFYRRKLPHHQLGESPLVISLRLNFTLPKHIIQALNQQRREYLDAQKKVSAEDLEDFKKEYHKARFEYYDKCLGKFKGSPINLMEPQYLNVITNSLHFLHQVKYFLISYCVMPNHVHILLKPMLIEGDDENEETYCSLSSILHSFKTFTS